MKKILVVFFLAAVIMFSVQGCKNTVAPASPLATSTPDAAQTIVAITNGVDAIHGTQTAVSNATAAAGLFTPANTVTLTCSFTATSTFTATAVSTDADTPDMTQTAGYIQTQIEIVSHFTRTFTATVTETLTVTSTATVTQTPVNTPIVSMIFDFENSLNGWDKVGYGGFIDCVSTTGTAEVIPYSGSYCAAIRYNLTAAAGVIFGTYDWFGISTDSDPMNLTGKTITAHVWVPAALTAGPYKLQIQILSDNYAIFGHTYDLSTAAGNAWNTFTYSPSPGVGEEKTRRVDIELIQWGGNPTDGTFYADGITIN